MAYADFARNSPIEPPSDVLFEEHARSIHYAGAKLGLWSICSWPPSDPNRRNAMYALAHAAVFGDWRPAAEGEG